MQFAIDRLIEFVINKWTGFVPTNDLFLNPNLGGEKRWCYNTPFGFPLITQKW